MNVCRSCLCLELIAQLKRELSAQVQREQEAPQNARLVMLDVHPPRNYQAFVITIKFRDQKGAKCALSIPDKMGLQRKVVISLEESFQRILPSDIDMEISPIHKSSLLDEQRK